MTRRGKLVQFTWVRANKGTDTLPEVRCRLMAQELGYGHRLDELVAGTPTLTIVKLLLSVLAERDLVVTLLDVKCAFLYGIIRRNVYIELRRLDPKSVDTNLIGMFQKGNGTRDALLIWGHVKELMKPMGFRASELHPSVHWHEKQGVTVVVHVGDFSCIGSAGELDWLYVALKEKCDLRRTLLEPGSHKEAKYLNPIIKWGVHGVRWESDPKHAGTLLREFDREECKGKETPVTKEGEQGRNRTATHRGVG